MTRLHSADQEPIVIERAAVTSTNTEVSLKVRTVYGTSHEKKNAVLLDFVQKQANRNNLLVACPPQTKMCSIKLIFWQPLRMRNIEGLRAPFLLFSFNHFYLCEWFWGYFMSNPFKAWSQKWLITISWKIWKVQRMQIRVWGRLAPKEKG